MKKIRCAILVGLNLSRPFGTNRRLTFVPALKRWAILVCPSGTRKCGLVFGAGLVVAGFVLHAAEKFSLPPETATFKSGPGAELALAQCLLCHSADYVST